jgi:hypothetical protein
VGLNKFGLTALRTLPIGNAVGGIQTCAEVLLLRMARSPTSVVTGNANRHTALAGIAPGVCAAPPRRRSKRYRKHGGLWPPWKAAVLAGRVCRYPASPRASRMAAPDSPALGMKPKAGLAATSSAKSSSSCVEIKMVGTPAPNPFR